MVYDGDLRGTAPGLTGRCQRKTTDTGTLELPAGLRCLLSVQTGEAGTVQGIAILVDGHQKWRCLLQLAHLACRCSIEATAGAFGGRESADLDIP